MNVCGNPCGDYVVFRREGDWLIFRDYVVASTRTPQGLYKRLMPCYGSAWGYGEMQDDMLYQAQIKDYLEPLISNAPLITPSCEVWKCGKSYTNALSCLGVAGFMLCSL